MRARVSLTTVLMLLALVLGGCWDRSEIDDQMYVIGLGIDRGDAPGEYLVTAEVALIQMFSSGTLEAPVKPNRPFLGVIRLTARAGSVMQAVHILNGGTTRRLDLRHLRVIVVGEELARGGLERLVTELLRNPLTRGSNMLIQARGSAHDLLDQLEPVGEMNVSRMAEGYMLQAKQLHLAPPVRLLHFIQQVVSRGGDPYLPAMAVNASVASGEPLPGPLPEASAHPGELARAGGNKVELIGTAVFQRDRLAGFLTVDETQMLLALRGQMGKAYVSIPDPVRAGYLVAMRFHQENVPTRRAQVQGDKPGVTMTIRFEGEVLSIPSGVDYTEPGLRSRLEQAANVYVETTIRGMLAKLRNWEVDPVGFGDLFRSRFASWDDWSAWDWHHRVKDLQVAVKSQMRVRRYGLVTGGQILR